MGKQAFEKFINKEPTGAKKKEAIRQEKRQMKKESREAGEEYRRKLREKKYGIQNTGYEASGTKNDAGRRDNKEDSSKKRVLVKKDGRKESKSVGRARTFEVTGKKEGISGSRKIVRPVKQNDKAKGFVQPKTGQATSYEPSNEKGKQFTHTTANNHSAELMPLNKFIAHAGVCGRREAAGLVKQGKVTVNGSIIYEPGFKVSPVDKITAKGKALFLQHNLVYILLNKPKDFLTTAKDPEGRKTVLDLIAAATKERVYPVGRLDRNTTGVLLLTNDGELAQKLTHPSFEVKKLYEVKLDKPLTKKDLETILNGVTLEDGPVTADAVAYADSKDKSIVGIEIHSGRNRIVRRIFEHLGYDVKNLDRVMFANLTKKNVDRGKWRFLNEKEVRLLKYMNQAFVRGKKDKDNAAKKEHDWKSEELEQE